MDSLRRLRLRLLLLLHHSWVGVCKGWGIWLVVLRTGWGVTFYFLLDGPDEEAEHIADLIVLQNKDAILL